MIPCNVVGGTDIYNLPLSYEGLESYVSNHVQKCLALRFMMVILIEI